MSGLLFKSNPIPVNNRLGGVRVQTSVLGVPKPIIYGRNRIAGNLIWYGGFSSRPINSKGGKGGLFGAGGKAGNQTYDYGATVIIGICQGPITGVGSVWDTQGTLPINYTAEEFSMPGSGRCSPNLR